MKSSSIFLAMLLCAGAQGATSDLLFPQSSSTMTGLVGNVVFNGQHFVTPVVQSNAPLRLAFLDTNGSVVSNWSLSITGDSPRVLCLGQDYLLAWRNTAVPNAAAPVLSFAKISPGGTVGPITLFATNIVKDSISLSAAGASLLAVWDGGTSGITFACTLDANGTPTSSPLTVSTGAQPQHFPSVANDGTNHLVAWMEQNTGDIECGGSNYWRVMARRLAGDGTPGDLWTISQTNSMRPYPTACSFGTNFLVLWSSDHTVSWNAAEPCLDAQRYPALHRRMVGNGPVGAESSLMASPVHLGMGIAYFGNTRPGVAFGQGRYLVTCVETTGRRRTQLLAADGSRTAYPLIVTRSFDLTDSTRLAFGSGHFMAFYSDWNGDTRAFRLGPETMPDLRLTQVHRTNNSIAVSAFTAPSTVEVSTNFIHWEKRLLSELPSLGGRPQLYVRQVDYHWVCAGNLRLIDWTKQNWGFNFLKFGYQTPSDIDLFSQPFPKPACPNGGLYILDNLDVKPTCTVVGHTI
jgi:hypothetical protein